VDGDILQQSDATCAVGDARGFALQLLNESIAKSIVISLILVADEYKLAQHSKRWEDCGSSSERASNVQFLVALGNDCYRILKVHLPDVLQISHMKTKAQTNAMRSKGSSRHSGSGGADPGAAAVRQVGGGVGGMVLPLDSLVDGKRNTCVCNIIYRFIDV
jgi:hypothetical protein